MNKEIRNNAKQTAFGIGIALTIMTGIFKLFQFMFSYGRRRENKHIEETQILSTSPGIISDIHSTGNTENVEIKTLKLINEDNGKIRMFALSQFDNRADLVEIGDSFEVA